MLTVTGCMNDLSDEEYKYDSFFSFLFLSLMSYNQNWWDFKCLSLFPVRGWSSARKTVVNGDNWKSISLLLLLFVFIFRWLLVEFEFVIIIDEIFSNEFVNERFERLLNDGSTIPKIISHEYLVKVLMLLLKTVYQMNWLLLLVHLMIKQLILTVDHYCLMVVEEIARANVSLILLMIQVVVDKQLDMPEMNRYSY
jgi:hypothetical protein